jgi:hypothetical protein
MSSFRPPRIVLVVAALAGLLVLQACGAGSSGEPAFSPQGKSEKRTTTTSSAETAKDANPGGKKSSSGHRAANHENGKRAGGQKNPRPSKPHRTPVERLTERLRKQVGSSPSGKRILSSPKKIRQVLRELQDDSPDGNGSQQLDQTINQVINQLND